MHLCWFVDFESEEKIWESVAHVDVFIVVTKQIMLSTMRVMNQRVKMGLSRRGTNQTVMILRLNPRVKNRLRKLEEETRRRRNLRRKKSLKKIQLSVLTLK